VNQKKRKTYMPPKANDKAQAKEGCPEKGRRPRKGMGEPPIQQQQQGNSYISNTLIFLSLEISQLFQFSFLEPNVRGSGAKWLLSQSCVSVVNIFQ